MTDPEKLAVLMHGAYLEWNSAVQPETPGGSAVPWQALEHLVRSKLLYVASRLLAAGYTPSPVKETP